MVFDWFKRGAANPEPTPSPVPEAAEPPAAAELVSAPGAPTPLEAAPPVALTTPAAGAVQTPVAAGPGVDQDALAWARQAYARLKAQQEAAAAAAAPQPPSPGQPPPDSGRGDGIRAADLSVQAVQNPQGAALNPSPPGLLAAAAALGAAEPQAAAGATQVWEPSPAAAELDAAVSPAPSQAPGAVDGVFSPSAPQLSLIHI